MAQVYWSLINWTPSERTKAERRIWDSHGGKKMAVFRKRKSFVMKWIKDSLMTGSSSFESFWLHYCGGRATAHDHKKWENLVAFVERNAIKRSSHLIHSFAEQNVWALPVKWAIATPSALVFPLHISVIIVMTLLVITVNRTGNKAESCSRSLCMYKRRCP